MKRMLQKPYIPPVHRVQLRTIARQNRVIREQAAIIRSFGEKAAGKIEGEKGIQQPGGPAEKESLKPTAAQKTKFALLVVAPLALVLVGAISLFAWSVYNFDKFPQKKEAGVSAAANEEELPPAAQQMVQRIAERVRALAEENRAMEAATQAGARPPEHVFVRPSDSCCGGAQR